MGAISAIFGGKPGFGCEEEAVESEGTLAGNQVLPMENERLLL